MREAPSKAERIALAVVGVAVVGFAVHGYAHHVPSTTAYLLTVVLLGVLIGVVRRAPLPDLLAYGLAIDAVAHLSGGLVRVGHGVLYNAGLTPRSARFETRLLQTDHVVHAYGSFIAAMVIWVLVVRPLAIRGHAAAVALLCFLGSMGVGAVNELIEFVVTLLNEKSHVGGYANTGWDLVANALGAAVAGLVVWRVERRATVP